MDYYKPGDWLVTCDSCGKKMKASHTKHRWDGFIVCDSCWEPRHSHDFIKVKYDKQEVPFSRRPQEIFTDVPYIVPLSCTPLSKLPQADFGTADCAIVNTPNTVIDYVADCIDETLFGPVAAEIDHVVIFPDYLITVEHFYTLLAEYTIIYKRDKDDYSVISAMTQDGDWNGFNRMYGAVRGAGEIMYVVGWNTNDLNSKVLRIDCSTLTVTHVYENTIGTPVPSTYLRGIAYANGNLWADQLTSLKKLDADDLTLLSSVAITPVGAPWPYNSLKTDGTDIYVITSSGLEKVDGIAGTTSVLAADATGFVGALYNGFVYCNDATSPVKYNSSTGAKIALLSGLSSYVGDVVGGVIGGSGIIYCMHSDVSRIRSGGDFYHIGGNVFLSTSRVGYEADTAWNAKKICCVGDPELQTVYLAAVAEHRGGSSTLLAYYIANTGESTWSSYFSEFGGMAVLGWDETAGTADTGTIPVSPLTRPFDTSLVHTLQCYSGSSFGSSDAHADIEFLDAGNNVIAAIRVTKYSGNYGSKIEIGASLITLGTPSIGSVMVSGRVEFTGTSIDYVNEYPVFGGAAGVSYSCDTTLITQVRISDARAVEGSGIGVACVIFQRRLP